METFVVKRNEQLKWIIKVNHPNGSQKGHSRSATAIGVDETHLTSLQIVWNDCGEGIAQGHRPRRRAHNPQQPQGRGNKIKTQEHFECPGCGLPRHAVLPGSQFHRSQFVVNPQLEADIQHDGPYPLLAEALEIDGRSWSNPYEALYLTE
jgi:hypothetical protein